MFNDIAEGFVILAIIVILNYENADVWKKVQKVNHRKRLQEVVSSIWPMLASIQFVIFMR